jgi:hypothetical protein
MLFRLFRRPPRDTFGLGDDADVPSPAPSADAGTADDPLMEPMTPPRTHLKPIIATVALLGGLGALYLSWGGGASQDDMRASRLLPADRSPLAAAPAPAGPGPSGNAVAVGPAAVPSAPMPAGVAPAPTGAPPPSVGPAAGPAPTFYGPLQRDTPAMPADPSPGGRGYQTVADASHDVTIETLRAQVAETRLKKLKAELEEAELKKNPGRLFKSDNKPAEAPLAALERVSRALPALGPVPGPPVSGPVPLAPHPAGAVAAPPTPPPPAAPTMRVRMVSVEPTKEAVVEAGDADNRGWFTVHEGQRFPDFIVTSITPDGVTISMGGRGFFYPVGGLALGAPTGPERKPAQSAAARDGAAGK